MIYNFTASFGFMLTQEGGWSNNPADPGGPTMHGITLASFTSWRRRYGRPDPTAEDLRNISLFEEQQFYRINYWDTVKGDELPDGLDLSVFDFGVNAGPSRSIQLLQEACGLKGADIDGMIGPITIAAAERMSSFILIALLADKQEHYYRSLPTFPTFGKGWLARTQRRRAAAMALVSGRAYPTSLTGA